jgi:DNA-binding transcriptional LysR family regulator
VITPKKHPLAGRKHVSFAATLDFDYIGLRSGSNINMQLVNAASELGRTLKLRVQVTGYDALCVMVNAGIGVGILPSQCASLYRKVLNLSVLGLDETWAHRELSLCVRTYQSLTPAAKLFVDHLRETTPSREPAASAR